MLGVSHQSRDWLWRFISKALTSSLQLQRMLIVVRCVPGVEMGSDSTHSCIMGQHIPSDDCSRWKQRPIKVHDSAVFTARFRPSDAGSYLPLGYHTCCGWAADAAVSLVSDAGSWSIQSTSLSEWWIQSSVTVCHCVNWDLYSVSQSD